MTTTVALAGSTGSIGTQAIDVVRAEPGRYRVVALAASGASPASVDALVSQATELSPEVVVVASEDHADRLARGLESLRCEVRVGPEALRGVGAEADVCVNGVVGFAGLSVTLETLRAGRRLALANKESLIAGGPVVQAVRDTPGAELVPVDSEHCAIHQCLAGAGEAGTDAVAGLVLTASGGPFRGRSRDELATVEVGEALTHPTWSMGPKITVDSSTLMNKGLEVIEAHELFGIGYDAIEVVVHPQSIVHSMVTFTDGATLAQLSEPDMRGPIAYALAWPDRARVPSGALDWGAPRQLTFSAPDRETFACLDLAYAAGRLGGTGPAWLSAANEVAVEAFLDGRIGWLDIADVCNRVLNRHDGAHPTEPGDVIEADERARAIARAEIEAR